MKHGHFCMEMVSSMREIILDAGRMGDKKDFIEYMNELFSLDVNNLDALYDALTEVSEEIRFIIYRESLREIVDSAYAYKLLRLISRAVEHNPCLSMVFL